MQRQLRILLAGVMVLAPLAVTVWIIWGVGSSLDQMGRNLFPGPDLPPGVGAAVVIVGIYLAGLLTHFWVFQGMLAGLDKLVARVPGVKTIYESVRDLLKLFGGDSARMGRVVRYKMPGGDMSMLAILTNEAPAGLDPSGPDGRKVAIYLPYSYMFGGITVFVSPENICEVDMPVERALKLCATAQVTPSSDDSSAKS
ncbi:MAG: DUF502 domain-containing protein [Phycisphaerae bacterium]|nr:DUF502 domain-containing protein [Phycisphaerae bacterium]